jgi:hypothetical protein
MHVQVHFLDGLKAFNAGCMHADHLTKVKIEFAASSFPWIATI